MYSMDTRFAVLPVISFANLSERSVETGIEMARHEADREDLIREAVALPNRAEFALGGECPVCDGGVSIERCDERVF